MYGQKERGDLMSPKGRPTDNPKKGTFCKYELHRKRKKCWTIVVKLPEKNVTDIIRLGIRKVYEELKK